MEHTENPLMRVVVSANFVRHKLNSYIQLIVNWMILRVVLINN